MNRRSILVVTFAASITLIGIARVQSAFASEEKEPTPGAKKKQATKEAKQKPGDAAATSRTVVTSARTLDPQWVGAMPWRPIGPSAMGGRIIDLAVVGSETSTYYVATASGGLFKTENRGITFEPVFEKERTISIGDICIAPSDPNIIWVGTGENNARNSVSWGDGVYKSVNAGRTWKHMGLDKTFQTGRIVIHPTNPDIVYVAALGRLWGENKERGLFKTTDGGRTWETVLYIDTKTGCIDIAMSPDEPNTLLAAMYERQRDGFDSNDPAKRWGPGSGLFKSTNGGRSWIKLSKGLPTVALGRIGIAFSHKNPQRIFAIVETEKIGTAPLGSTLPAFMGIQGADAEGGARLTSITTGGPSEKAGLKAGDIVVAVDDKEVKSYRGLVEQIRAHKAGDKVKVRVRRGDETKEVELTFARRGGSQGSSSRPFAGRLGGQVENIHDRQGPQGFETGGVFQSDDGGESWTRINSLNPRPFYYSQIRVDPSDDIHVHVLGVSLYRSEDGGKTFRNDAGRSVHSDHHAMWIDPRDGRHIVLGGDGGLYVTHDRTEHWEFINSLPIGQFYHVTTDSRLNYRVYGGLQDNGSWGGPNRSRGSAGPTADDWVAIGGGDGFVCRVDADDPDLVYYESQYGRMGRVNLRTGARGRIRPSAVRGERHRFNWKTPFVLSHHNSRIFYCAGNFVFKSLDRGEILRKISPEISLTKRGSATAFAESPMNPLVLYAGTDDGALWVTKNGGHDWTKLNGKLKGHVPGPRWVSTIEASRYKEGRVYVCFDGHRSNDDQPHVLVSEDYGSSWTSLRANLPEGSTRVLREDLRNENLLFVGTEFGIWASVDRGKDWTRLNGNLPTVAIHEIAIHPTLAEIVAATHGRSLWVLDITPLRQWTQEVAKSESYLFQPPPAILWGGVTGKRYYGHQRYIGKNPPSGVPLYYYLAGKAKDVRLEIIDEDGQTARAIRGSAEPGLHSSLWDLRRIVRRRNAPAQSARRVGNRVGPGVFHVKLTVDGMEIRKKVRVNRDPDLPDTTLTFEEEEFIRQREKAVDD